MAATIRLRGHRSDSEEALESGLPTSFGSTVQLAVNTDPTSRSADQAFDASAEADDLLEVDLGNGLLLWITVEQYLRDTAQQGLNERARKPQELFPQYPMLHGGSARGRVSWTVKGLKTLGVDIVELGAYKTIDLLAAAIEDDRLAHHDGKVGGLFHFDGTTLGDAVTHADQISGPEPILVFIHGTFSTTAGAFANLKKAHPKAWEHLAKEYDHGRRIYGFDHRTLTRSPLENARDLLDVLPPNVPVHLVTHSRGGLVGEVLCAGSRQTDRPGKVFHDHYLELFERSEDKRALEALNERFAAGAPTIERYVRVACPARGTTLMDDRADLWLSAIVNVAKYSAKALGKALGVPTAGVAGDLADVANICADILVAAAKLRTNPLALPGLEAMLTTSPMVGLLNTFPRVDARLTAIAGTFEGSGVLGTIAKFVSDRYYGEPHDLVVPTESMKRGIRREDGRYLDVPAVGHIEYFVHPKSVNALVDTLTASGDSSFQPLPTRSRSATPEPSQGDSASATHAIDDDARLDRGDGPAKAQPTLYVLPGILGSNLQAGDDRIWLDFLDLARGRFKDLAIDADNIAAHGLHAGAYGKFLRAANAHFTVVSHAYDWRLSLPDLGDELAAALAQTLDASEQPVHLIAHSMGGLVARAMMVRQPDLWERIVARGGRLLMAGTPNSGSYAPVRALLGQNRMIQLLDIVDRHNDREALLEVLKAFPGFLQLLPQVGLGKHQGTDHFTAEPWQRYRELLPTGWCLPATSALSRAANAVGDIIGHPLAHPEHVLYVAGAARRTPAGVTTEDGKVAFISSRRGDGTVLWDGGIPAGVKAWFVRAAHGDLLDRKQYFRAYFDLLTRGTTAELPSAPPVARDQDTLTALEDATPPQYFPDESDLFDEYLGGTSESAEAPPVDVRVVHGDLRWSKHPVLIGHYLDDGIYNAEQALDETLDYRLGQRLALDDYPGPVGTAAVFLRNPGDADAPTHKGAVVVGLGTVGDIQPAALTVALARGMRSYAARCSELQPQCVVEGLKLTALLVASGEGGVGTQDSLRALLTALRMTNRKIDEVNAIATGSDRSSRLIARISALDIYELYHDRALTAQRDLVSLSNEHDFLYWMEAQQTLAREPGGFHRTVFEEHNAWWTRLTIERLTDPTDDGAPPLGFKFTTLAERARSGEHTVVIQWSLVDELLQHAMNDDQDAFGDRRAMFELLLPRSFKQAAAERRHVVLVVDDKAASYPWELFLDRDPKDTGERGPASTGLLRSLREERPQAVSHSTELSALVLGDPTPPEDPDFVQLDGAREEALHVIDRLGRAGWDTSHSLVRGTASIGTADVLRALYARDYRILHIAGHGVYDPQNPRRSGIIIGTASGDGYAERAATRRLLTPGEVRQLPVTPELVFINCCHVGAIDDSDDLPAHQRRSDRHLLAGNLAAEFIRMGVKAVVAAGWAVDDAAARAFAETFYDQMLRGQDFGKAVIEARSKAHGVAEDSNTWAAYQCYGNPQFRLVVRDHETRPFTFRTYVDASEAIVDLRNLAAMAHQGKEQSREQCHKGLESILESMPLGWEQQPEVATAIAQLYGELDDFAKAVTYYDKAITSGIEGSNVPISAIEQRANLRARAAENQAFDTIDAGSILSTRAKRAAIAQVRQSISDLESLRRIDTTSEREGLLGSAHKSLAALYMLPAADQASTDRRPAINALAKMAHHYFKADELKSDDMYGATNVFISLSLLQHVAPEIYQNPKYRFPSPEELRTQGDGLLKRARARADRPENFWDLAVELDVLLGQQIVGRNTPGDPRQEWESRRQRVFESSLGSARVRRSVTRQERFVALLRDAGKQSQ